MSCMGFSCRLGATVSILRQRAVGEGEGEERLVTEVLVRKVPDDQQVSCLVYN